MSVKIQSALQEVGQSSGAMFIKRRIVSPTIHALRRLKYAAIGLANRSVVPVPTRHGRIVYFAPSTRTVMRATTLFTKEPETIRWIDSFQDGDVLWDIGASTGPYTIYAAANPTITVLAFEPSPASFANLCRSIELNQMDDRVFAYCIAMHDKRQLSTFNMQSTRVGFAGSALNRARTPVGAEFEPAFRQAAIGYTIDRFIEDFDPPFPSHIKIDVDGNDHLVLEGGAQTLADRRVKSVLVELMGGEREARGLKLLQDKGFELDAGSSEARINRVFRR